MADKTYLEFNNFDELYSWFLTNSKTSNELLVKIKRGDPNKTGGVLSYFDAVYVALCFGWIDSVLRNIDGVLVQRFSPRRNNAKWTERNLERVRMLINMGKMREEGLNVCPDLDKPLHDYSKIITEIKKDKEAYDFFKNTYELYQKIKLQYVYDLSIIDKAKYYEALEKLITYSKNHKYIGEWSDYGRLIITRG